MTKIQKELHFLINSTLPPQKYFSWRAKEQAMKACSG